MPERVTKLEGRVTSGNVGEGTKSFHRATLLETSDGAHRYVLRKKGGPAFGDTELNRLEGELVVCSGFLFGGTLLVEDIRVVE